MRTSEFQQIASYATETEAGQYRSILAQNGIDAFLDGANSNTMLSHVGTALGGVRLFVRTADAEQATQVLSARSDPNDANQSAWLCGHCQEEVDAGFDLCWSCGKSREEVGREVSTPVVTENFSDRKESAEARDSQAENLVRRAWRAAIIGLCIFPIIAHIYSLFFLVRAALIKNELTANVQKLYYRTLGIDVVAICFWSVVIRYFM